MLQEIQTESKEYTEQNGVEGYWRLGGKLNEQSFDKAMGLMSKITAGENPLVGEIFLALADNMAKSSKVPITHEQRYLYASLREMPDETDKKLNSLSESYGTEPWKLTDQPLMAEVLLLTGGISEYRRFKHAYPNIFPTTT